MARSEPLRTESRRENSVPCSERLRRRSKVTPAAGRNVMVTVRPPSARMLRTPSAGIFQAVPSDSIQGTNSAPVAATPAPRSAINGNRIAFLYKTEVIAPPLAGSTAIRRNSFSSSRGSVAIAETANAPSAAMQIVRDIAAPYLPTLAVRGHGVNLQAMLFHLREQPKF